MPQKKKPLPRKPETKVAKSPQKQVKKKPQETESKRPQEEAINDFEILKDLPEEKREKVVTMMKESMSFMGVMNQQHPLMEKITSEHITDLIKNSDVEDQRDRQERKTERNFNLAILIIVLVIVIGLIIYLVEKQEKSLLDSIIGAILGFGGGFGVGKYTKKR